MTQRTVLGLPSILEGDVKINGMIVKHEPQPPPRNVRTARSAFLDLFSRVNQSTFFC